MPSTEDRSSNTERRPRIAIIIVSWNALPIVQRCLPSVVASVQDGRLEAEVEIVFADNASEDGTAGWVEAAYPSVRVLRFPENYGFCRGNNEAIQRTSSEYVVLLNNDVEVASGWLAPLQKRMDADSELAALQPKLKQFDKRDHFEYAGGAGGHVDRLGFPFTRGRLFFTLEQDTGQYDEPTDVFWASGAAMMIRRSALDEVGLLDERFVMHMEEIDLCWRLQRAGYRIGVEPASEAYHIGGASLPQGNPRKTFYNFRNGLLMLHKNLPPSVAQGVLRERAWFDRIAYLRALASGNRPEANAITEARAAFQTMRHEFDPPSESDPVVLPSYQGRLVVDYFLRQRRTFKALPAAHFSDWHATHR
ncbi:MAG: glycosyltransferase family 2 protein [Bacteroidota bacterium]